MEVSPDYGCTYMDNFNHLPQELALKIAGKFVDSYQADINGNQTYPEPVFDNRKHTNGVKTKREIAREKVINDHNQTNFEVEPKDIPEEQSNH